MNEKFLKTYPNLVLYNLNICLANNIVLFRYRKHFFCKQNDIKKSKNVINHHVKNGHKDFLVIVIKLSELYLTV